MIGKTVSHYKIIEELGHGGMGVVYKAEDTRLKRTVALKFLAPEFTKDAEAKKRLLYEAQAASSLDHTNICSIYEIDETDDGQIYIAMAFYEGESLKQKIKRGPVALNQVIDITTQIAAGLKQAHEKGIVHRDIKSANIMITKENQVKIMDFGLAKLAGLTKLTMTGTTMGTAAYMSPEQARGEKIDHRTDIWSLGVVMYEMLTGLLPFRGDYDQAVTYSILNEAPEPITGLRTGVPIELERIVNKLMAKDPKDRYQHMDELPVDLKNIDLTMIGPSRISNHPAAQFKKQSPTWLRAIPWSITALVIIAAFISIWILRHPTHLPVKRWNINLPESAPIAPIGSAPLGITQPALAISKDGMNIVYVADIGGETQLYIRSLDKYDVIPVPDTEGAYCPFFSPDGQWIGYFAGNELKKVALSSGTPASLCEVTHSYGATWSPSNKIIFSQHEGDVLSIIPVAGGTPEDLTDKHPDYYWPEILPAGNALLVSGGLGTGIRSISLDTGDEKVLLDRGGNPRYVRSGHLIFTRDGILQAVPFDLDNQKVIGSPMPVLDDIRTEAQKGVAQWSVSDEGTLVYLPGVSETKNELIWLDRKGKIENTVFPAEIYGTFQISPDGRKLAIQIFKNTKWNVWIYDLVRGSRIKLTLEGKNAHPIWTPDSKKVTFDSDRTGYCNLFLKYMEGRNEITQLTESENTQHPYSWSPDGNVLAFTENTPDNDIMLLSVNGERKQQPFANTDFSEWGPAFSPDGRWIAYVSDEQGRYDVYVQPYPQTGERWKVSTEGGEEPVWSPTNQELFYRNGRKWMVVSYSTGSAFTPNIPKVLFEGDYVNVGGRSYDVSPDGQRFLLVKSNGESKAHTQLNVVTNWFEELRRKVPKTR
jgi:serine/threonine protein kinase